MATVTKGLWVPLEAKPGKEADVARFLEGGRSLVEDEPDNDRVVRGPARRRVVHVAKHDVAAVRPLFALDDLDERLRLHAASG